MPSTRHLRRRIRSIKSTAQITKAMQMVAASKMRKAQEAALAGRPYALQLNRVLAEVTTRAGDFTHALLETREVRKRALVLVSTDRGLCGALNGNLQREALKAEAATTLHLAVGRKAAQFVARTRRSLVAEFTYHDPPLFSEARAISKMARKVFLEGQVDAVDVLFTNFVNTLTQRPMRINFLPVAEFRAVVAGVTDEVRPAEPARTDIADFQFEPDPEVVLGNLLPHYLNYIIYQVLLEARASEHSARMVAMKSATDNAHQLIKDLTLEYNKMRQAAITKELLEISSAAMALG
jgi:F-type H+-transporting ATPase subunit gamma